LGLSQLRKLLHFIERRREIATKYNQRFSECDVSMPSMHTYKKSVFYRYVLMASKLEHIQKAAKKSGIICERPVWKPLHQSLHSIKCPNSDYAYDHALSIPLYPSLTDIEVEYVARTLEKVLIRGG